MVKEFDLGTRIQALTLHSEGYSRGDIIEKTGYTSSGLYSLLHKAKKRGYKPGEGPILREYAETEAGKGRPTIITEERRIRIIAILTSETAPRKISTQEMANRFNQQKTDEQAVSRRTVLKVLTAEGYKRVKYI